MDSPTLHYLEPGTWYNKNGHGHNSIMVSGSSKIAKGWPILSVHSFFILEMSSVYLLLIDFALHDAGCDYQLVCHLHLCLDPQYTDHIS